MAKLKHAIISNVFDSITHEERDEKISYYRDLFWLTFRVFDEDEIAQEELDEYLDCYSSNDESDIDFFQNKFASLNALDVFYKLCLDYYQEQLVVLKKHAVKYKTAEINQLEQPVKKKHLDMLANIKAGKIEANLHAQNECQTQILLMQNKLAELEITKN